MQYIPKSNFDIFSIGKAIKRGWKPSGDQEGLVLMKDNVKLVFHLKTTTKNGVIFCVHLWRDHEVGVILSSNSPAMSIQKAHIITRHYDEE